MATAMSMMDKTAARAEKAAWPKSLSEEFAREAERPNGCVGNQLVSENDRVRV